MDKKACSWNFPVHMRYSMAHSLPKPFTYSFVVNKRSHHSIPRIIPPIKETSPFLSPSLSVKSPLKGTELNLCQWIQSDPAPHPFHDLQHLSHLLWSGRLWGKPRKKSELSFRNVGLRKGSNLSTCVSVRLCSNMTWGGGFMRPTSYTVENPCSHFLKYFYVHVWVPTYMYVHSMRTWYLWRPEEGIGSLELNL